MTQHDRALVLVHVDVEGRPRRDQPEYEVVAQLVDAPIRMATLLSVGIRQGDECRTPVALSTVSSRELAGMQRDAE